MAAVVAIAMFLSTLPPKQFHLSSSSPDGTIPGILHVHSARSDGRGTLDEIARAAARAGLKFIVVTDHGDATRAPDPPVYRGGVLCLDAVEISTTGGHYLALDMPAAPYPLAGDAARRRRRREAARRVRDRGASRFAQARAALARLGRAV